MHGPTLLILASILLGGVTAVIFTVRFFNRKIPGLHFWALSYLCCFAVTIALLVRAQSAHVLSVVLVQTLTFSLAYLNVLAARAYIGRRQWPHWYAGVALTALLSASAYFTMLEPNAALRVILLNTACGMLFVCSAVALATGEVRSYPARYYFALVSGAHGLFLILRSWLFAPVGVNALRVDGSLAVSEFVVLETIVALLLMAFGVLMLAHEHTTTELRRLAERDPLTGVFNRRSFIILLDKAMHLARRMNTPLAVLVVDLDHFKRINDSWGHRSGDLALRHFIEIATLNLRNADLLGRIGGEEFALFLPNTTFEEAMAVAERLRLDIATHPAKGDHGPIPLTVSIGVTQCGMRETPEFVLHRADEAMYQAKRSGRNRVEALEPNDYSLTKLAGSNT